MPEGELQDDFDEVPENGHGPDGEDPEQPEEPAEPEEPGEPQDELEETPELAAEAVELVRKQPVQDTLPGSQKKVDGLRVLEAALFLGNKPLAFPEIALLAKTSVKRAKDLVEKLKTEYESKGGAIEVVVNAQEAVMQVKPDFLGPVSELSRDVDLSRKATKMLSLIAKKGKMLQSELRRYFRGEIYAYVAELKERGYVTSDKAGATRLLRPTEKFKQTFQVAGG